MLTDLSHLNLFIEHNYLTPLMQLQRVVNSVLLIIMKHVLILITLGAAPATRGMLLTATLQGRLRAMQIAGQNNLVRKPS